MKHRSSPGMRRRRRRWEAPCFQARISSYRRLPGRLVYWQLRLVLRSFVRLVQRCLAGRTHRPRPTEFTICSFSKSYSLAEDRLQASQRGGLQFPADDAAPHVSRQGINGVMIYTHTPMWVIPGRLEKIISRKIPLGIGRQAEARELGGSRSFTFGSSVY